MKSLVNDAAVGLLFAGLGSLLVRINGFNQLTLVILLYLTIGAAVFQGLRYSRSDLFDFSNPLNRLVIVKEGEELEMRKLISGEKYKIKGSLEKL